jgi:preprotein translocase subunit YajC
MQSIILATQNPTSNPMFLFLPYIAIIVVVFLLTNRSKKRRQEQLQQIKSETVKGTEVVTIGGLHGIIDSKDEVNHTVTLDVEGVFLTFDERAIANIATNPVLSKGPSSASSSTTKKAVAKKPATTVKKTTKK